MKNDPLFKIRDNFIGIQTLVNNNDDLDPLQFADQIDAIDGSFETKALDICSVIKNIESDLPCIDYEINRLKARAERIKSKSGHIRKYLFDNMKAIGKTKIEDEINTISIRKGSNAVKVSEDDLLKIPDEYVTVNTIIKPDKRAIKKAIDNGEEIPGATLERNPDSLVIK